jgi:endoglucanase
VTVAVAALAALAPSPAEAASGGGGQTAGAVADEANPFAGQRLYVDPRSSAQRQVERWSTTRPQDAEAIRRIAREPQADWFGDWNEHVREAVADRVATVTAAGALPVLVAYNIPQRDCGGHSAGGARSPGAYRRWIRRFAAGIGHQRAVVILEPDALAAIDCLPEPKQRARLDLLAGALRVLRARPGIAAYVDAGHSNWQPASVMASRLEAVGVSRARGFSLNVANFQRTRTEIAYGSAVSSQIADKPFVIDTGRNGAGPPRNDNWCNPAGRALGRPPTASTGRSMVDAYLWIKPPGESDGPCGGGPPAGTWWPHYALELAGG